MASARATKTPPHPLDPLSTEEVRLAAKLLTQHLKAEADDIRFKVINLAEPPKDLVLQHLFEDGPVPDRKTRIYYHHRPTRQVLSVTVVNLTTRRVEKIEEREGAQGPVDWTEFSEIHDACVAHPDVLAEIAKLKLPPNAKVLTDPWAYGTDNHDENRRLFQCYMYASLNDDPQANHYSVPLPLAPVFDAHTLELVDLERLPLGVDAKLDPETQPWEPVKPVEYSAGVLGADAFRKDLQPLQVQQPKGPSFKITGRRIEWQKWSMQLGWTLREGPVLHDVRYDGRPLFYRVSMSEMTVPYGDPRTPNHRKQAFDLGDSGFGLTSNSLTLGCDCLGHIAYFDGVRSTASGEPVVMHNVVCMHEVDEGIGWKHTNFRNHASTVVRDCRLVIQCTATVANYEYIVAYVLDQAANLHIDVRATGIVSTMPIRAGTQVPWGTVVAPGVLAVNHQHLFCVRIDPHLDGSRNNTIKYDDCYPIINQPDLDPFGCAFNIASTTIKRPGGYDLDLTKARVYKIVNPSRKNAISGKEAGYRLHAVPSQMMMMGPHTFNYRRGVFAWRPIWVTRYRDDELWVAGEFTNQSKQDTGLAVWANRDEETENQDVVLWHSFGLTHVTRPEDFPVMPAEHISMSLKPENFFDVNPSNDVPRSSQSENNSKLFSHSDQACCRL